MQLLRDLYILRYFVYIMINWYMEITDNNKINTNWLFHISKQVIFSLINLPTEADYQNKCILAD